MLTRKQFSGVMEPTKVEFRTKTINGKEEEVPVDTNIVRITTNSVDRDGDVLVPSGCDYTGKVKVLNHHDYTAKTFPIAKPLWFKVTENEIICKIEWATGLNLESDKGKEISDIQKLYANGFLTDWSVGFEIVEANEPTQNDISVYGECNRIVSKWTLLEFSAVKIPCNPDANTIKSIRELKLSAKTLSEIGIKEDTKQEEDAKITEQQNKAADKVEVPAFSFEPAFEYEQPKFEYDIKQAVKIEMYKALGGV